MSDPTINSQTSDQEADQSQSNPQPASTPAPAPAAAAAAPNTSAQQAAPANSNPASHLHARIFDTVLKSLSGGPIMVNRAMPDGTVQRVAVPQSRGSMAKSIVAGAISGLFTPNSYRQTPNGPAIDNAATMSNAFNAAKDKRENLSAEAQRQVDDLDAHRMKNFENNAKMIQQATAMTVQKHSVLDPVAKSNQSGIIAAAKEADARRDINDPNDPEIFYGQGLQADQATGMLTGKDGKHKISDTNVVIDGTVDVMNPETGQMEAHPTYAILNPKAHLKLTKDQSDELAKYNTGFKNAYELTGGNLNLTAQDYTRATHLGNSLRISDDFFNRLIKNPDLKGLGLKPADLKAAYAKDPKGLAAAIDAATDAMSKSDLPYKVIQEVGHSPNGAKLLDLLGDGAADKLMKYANEEELTQVAAHKEAENKGIFAGKGITSVAAAERMIADPNAPDELKEQAKKFLEIDSAHAATKTGAETKARANANLGSIEAVAKNIITGDLANIADVVSRSGTEKQAMVNTLHTQAVARGLDPNDYSATALKAKSETWEDYHSTKNAKTTRSQLNSFDTFLTHAADAYSAAETLKHKPLAGFSVPMFNIPMNVLATKVSGDLDVKRFKDSLVPPGKEFMGFLNAGRAEHEADIQAMDKVLDGNSSPDQILQAMRDLATSADARTSAMGKTYLATMATTFPELLSQDGKATLQKLVGPKAASLRLSTRLPQGNDQVLSDPAIRKQFLDMANGKADLATKYARANGWYVPEKGTGRFGPPASPAAQPQQ